MIFPVVLNEIVCLHVQMELIWMSVPCSIRLSVSHGSSFSVCRRVHRNSPRHTLHTHKTSTRIRYSRPLLPGSSSAWHAPLWALKALNPACLFYSVGLGERGDARETATDRREGGGQRGGPRDAQAEEPPALLSLPNQTRAGAAGTGLLPLWSVPTHHSRVLIKGSLWLPPSNHCF